MCGTFLPQAGALMSRKDQSKPETYRAVKTSDEGRLGTCGRPRFAWLWLLRVAGRETPAGFPTSYN